MGLFDWLSRKPRKESQRPAERDEPTGRYVFALILLRQFAFENPLQLMGLLASPQAPSFIQALLDDLQTKLKQPVGFQAADVKAHPVRIGDYPAVIIQMPTPLETAEAHYTALVGLFQPSRALFESKDKLPARYFTLEKGLSMDNTPRTVLCEWTDTSHLNFGDGPPATAGDFAKSIEAMLDREDDSA